MDIVNKTVLVLGGFGLVGSAVARKLIPENPKRIIITSLHISEADEAVKKLKEEFPGKGADYFIPFGGDIFVRDEYKNENRQLLLNDPVKRKILMRDIMEEFSEDILKNSSIYKLLTEYKPDIIIDCINTATAIAYQDVYSSYRTITKSIENKVSYDSLVDEIEKLLCTIYIPQLIRHIQILYSSMSEVGTHIYIKIGTSGTGGMGLNIPYTHSEEKPSRVLLSKSSIAGAHTLLLFLMGRTPDTAITKEIKPTAAIAWKRIEYGEIKRRGKPIEISDIQLTEAVPLKDKFFICSDKTYRTSGKKLTSVFIDTGENGIFSRGEFETITAQKQMEFITPEEIADVVIFEVKGGNTGHDIVSALDHASMEPTYRAGYMQHMAVQKLDELEKKHGKSSVAFELLGPPRLSKLLYEIHLLRLFNKTMRDILNKSPEELSKKCFEIITNDADLRNEILAIGIPVLLPNGASLLRGNTIKIPAFRGENILDVNQKNINNWANEGWVDLRVSNMKKWQSRLTELIEEAETITAINTSSMHVRTKDYWNNFEEISIGKVCSWLFIHEEQGKRMKA
ncbi:MAG: short-chain dehydrogenase [Ignavibacteria bacterium GWC2_36_12]|nr:MAG: short-chain dehydrogenase [Ignavibacteria bacterium GWC2_36_12]